MIRQKIYMFVMMVFMGVSLFCTPVWSGPAESIAAVVNEDIITTTDLKDRVEMILKSSGQSVNNSLIQRMNPQALEGLIAETVQIQEARRQGSSVSEEEIKDGVRQIAENNKMTADKFYTMLRRQGVQMNSIERQIEAQIGWGKVIQKVLRPRVVVGESEIKAERARMASSSGKTEFLTAEIFLPVADTKDESKIRGLAETLASQIRKGKPFSALARQHSQSASAAQGGMIGWVQQGQLEIALDQALTKLKPGTISDPIKGEDGYYLFFVREARAISVATPDDAILTLREIIIDTSDMRKNEAEAEANAIAGDLSGCLDITKKAASDRRYRLTERKVSLGELTSSERTRLGKFVIGEPVKPEVNDGTAVVTMVCGRDEPKGNVASDDAMERKIGLQRLDNLQKRYLRDLISEAYIERRI